MYNQKLINASLNNEFSDFDLIFYNEKDSVTIGGFNTLRFSSEHIHEILLLSEKRCEIRVPILSIQYIKDVASMIYFGILHDQNTECSDSRQYLTLCAVADYLCIPFKITSANIDYSILLSPDVQHLDYALLKKLAAKSSNPIIRKAFKFETGNFVIFDRHYSRICWSNNTITRVGNRPMLSMYCRFLIKDNTIYNIGTGEIRKTIVSDIVGLSMDSKYAICSTIPEQLIIVNTYSGEHVYQIKNVYGKCTALSRYYFVQNENNFVVWTKEFSEDNVANYTNCTRGIKLYSSEIDKWITCHSYCPENDIINRVFYENDDYVNMEITCFPEIRTSKAFIYWTHDKKTYKLTGEWKIFSGRAVLLKENKLYYMHLLTKEFGILDGKNICCYFNRLIYVTEDIIDVFSGQILSKNYKKYKCNQVKQLLVPYFQE